MVSVDNANIIRLNTHGKIFEILADAEKALSLRNGENIDIMDVLAVENIYSDSKKGTLASENTMESIFKTSDPIEVAKIIIQKGEIPLTKEHKAQVREQKLRQVVTYISRHGVDPKTKYPHPPDRVRAALEEAGFKVDETKDVEKLVQDALKAIRPILAIKFMVKEIAAKIPAEYAARSYSVVNNFGKKIREDWQTDGSLIVVIEMPGGMEEEFHNQLNALCKGDVETKILNIKDTD